MSILFEICKDKSISPSWVEKMSSKAPYSYKRYTIPKRNGGSRLIAQPAKETKYLQYWVVENVIDSLPIHQSAMAYVEGKSIKQNAERHRTNKYVAKFDFKDFFPSIKAHDFIKHLDKYTPGKYNEEDKLLLTKILFIADKHLKNYRLSIGAPSSPALSNTILFDFDCLIEEYCAPAKITYTRYADDLTFSTNIPDILFKLPEKLREIIGSLEYPHLSLNEEKQVFTSKRFNRTITGIVITNEGNISLGRHRKRTYSSMVHRYSLGKLNPKEIKVLAGNLAFCKHIEPEFIERLKAKYTEDVVDAILKSS